MKWFMPPMPNTLSRMQAATQEPSTVTWTMSWLLTWYSPGSSFTASMLSWRSKYSLRATSASGGFIHRLALQPENVGRLVEALRMAGKEQTLLVQQRREFLQDPVLRRLVEVDHDVATEDGV